MRDILLPVKPIEHTYQIIWDAFGRWIPGLFDATRSLRAKVEHPFIVDKGQFGYTKNPLSRSGQDTAQLKTLFNLSNLWVARRHLMAATTLVTP